MSVAVKRAEAPQNINTRWRALKVPPLAPPSLLILLEAKGDVWTFQHPRSLVLYRCERDAAGNEQWFSNNPRWLARSNAK